jgi:hypothetical protein
MTISALVPGDELQATENTGQPGERGAGRFGARIMRIGILDDDVGTLGTDAADFPRWLDPLAEFVLACRAQHDHAIAEGQLRMRDCSALAGNDEVLFEPEGFA